MARIATSIASMASAPAPCGLRIGLLADLAPRKRGSMEDWLLALAREALRRGHRVALYCREPVAEEFRQELDSLAVPFSRVGALEEHPAASWRRLRRAHDVLHVNLASPLSRMALLCFAAWPARVIFVDHASRPPGEAAGPRPRLKMLVDRLLFSRIDSLVGVSHFIAADLVRHYPFAASRVRAIPNGVDLERFRPGQRSPVHAPPIQILTAANLIPEKGIHHLVASLERLPRGLTHLRIAGDGADAGRLRELVRSKGLEDAVTFLGLRNDLDELLRESDIFVHPARWQEAFGLTVAEAMASGCAVIASNVGAMPELLDGGAAGLLVPPEDEAALAVAILRLATEPELRADFAVRARRKVERYYSLERCVQAHINLCEGDAW